MATDFSLHPLEEVPFKQTSVLIRAVRYETPSKVTCLLKKGCDPNSPDGKNHVYPLMVACYMKNKKNRLAIFGVLLKYGADPSLTDAHGRNSVMYACALSLREEVELMVKDCDYNLNATDMCGDTPLHMCAKAGDVDTLGVVLREMQRYGMNVSVQNNSYLTPLSLAISHRHYDCARILYEVGGSPRFSKPQFDRLLSDTQTPSQQRHSKSAPVANRTITGIRKACSFPSDDGCVRIMYTNRYRPVTSPEDTRLHFLPQAHSRHNATRQFHIGKSRYMYGKIGEPGFKSPTLEKRGSSNILVRPATSMDCINVLLSSSMFRKSTTPAFCSPSKQIVKLDSEWLATINEYKAKESSDEVMTLHKMQNRVSFKSSAKQLVSSSSSSCPSSASSSTHQYAITRGKRSTNSPRLFRFKVPVTHNNAICEV